MKGLRTQSFNLRSMAGRHPLLMAVGAVVLCSLPGLALGVRTELSRTLDLVNQLALCALAMLVLVSTGWWGEVGLNGPSRWRHLHLTLVPLAGVLVTFGGLGGMAFAQWWPYGLLALLFAFQSEVWYRGILFRTLVPAYGPRRTVTLVALLFGAMHATALLAGAAPGVTLVKAAAAALCGYVLGALRLRTRTVWPGMLVTFAFILTNVLERGQASGELVPLDTERLAMEALLALVVFGCSRIWMRNVPDTVMPEPEHLRVG